MPLNEFSSRNASTALRSYDQEHPRTRFGLNPAMPSDAGRGDDLPVVSVIQRGCTRFKYNRKAVPLEGKCVQRLWAGEVVSQVMDGSGRS